mgnify:CR=1 FL=1
MDPMQIISLISFLLPKVISLIGHVEQWFSDTPKSGETKKAIVMGAAETITAGFAGMTTGGAKETWEKLKPLVDDFVEKAVEIAFKK